ncbi:CASP-like protein 5B3 isoform B [Glycine soja]|uniref:CASP-like protein n=1 Tax=Glycine soja TaxID=3848 RepID=A0A445IPK3_GLYSO|nr:CASP-like protein 5B3 isoform B [Glycine soja]
MKDFPGTPGTVLGLALRISQFVFAAGSIASMATTPSFFNFTAFCYLIASMGLQVIWSFVLALLDAYALVKKKVLHNAVLVSLFVVGDWVSLCLNLYSLVIHWFVTYSTSSDVTIFQLQVFLTTVHR